MLCHTVEHNHRIITSPWWNKPRQICDTTDYRLSARPYRIYHSWELPKSYEMDDWESEDDLYIKVDGQFYSLKEFCTVGMPHLPFPMGGAQLASNGYFCIASYNGHVYRVSIEETKVLMS